MENPFTNGVVTLSFDDGWKCIFKNGFPILQKANLKGTHFIISGTLDDGQFPQYMNLSDIGILEKSGHEIGCHTVSHKRLTEESPSIIENEIKLSLKYLVDNGLKVETFAYPFGLYNYDIIDVVKSAGFKSARSIIDGFNDADTNKFLLQCKAVKVGTSAEEVSAWVDTARRDGKWLILMFHQVDHEGREWSTTPETLEEIVENLVAKDLKVSTVKETMELLES